MNNIYKTFLVLWALTMSALAQTSNDTKILYQFKDALWNQTATTAKDSGSPGGKNATVNGTGVTFVNNGAGGTAIQYSITSSNAKLDGLTADWGEKFVLEARIKKSAVTGSNSEIHIFKNAATTGLDWYIDTNNKMVLKVGDGSSINIVSDTVVINAGGWVTLAAVVDLSQANIDDAVKFYVNESSIGSGNTPKLNQVIFDQTFTNRDFNANPLVIDNLQNDSYDYTVVIIAPAASTNANLRLRVNSDSSANYRSYYMRGQTSSTSAVVSDSETFLRVIDGINTQPAMCIATIKGTSGSERYINWFSGSATTGTKVYKGSGYWKNTTNEITSLNLDTDISANISLTVRIFQTPKASSTDNWELVDTLTWNNESTEKSFTGLDGNTDEEYKIVWEGDQSIKVECNNDNNSNYIRQYLRNNSGTLESLNNTATTISTSGINASIIFKARAGIERCITAEASNLVASQQNLRAFWWQNSTDNLTSLDLTPSLTGTGTALLYKKKHPNGVADKFNLPFEVVEVVDINGDFSAGHTFTNLTGDSEFMYKLEYLGTSTGTTSLRIEINSDSGSNYPYQRLLATNSTTSASSGSYDFLLLSSSANNSQGCTYIYPKSGSKRPALNFHSSNENDLRFYSSWWNNSSDEITSLKVFPERSETITGKLILSRIPLDYSNQQGSQTTQVVAGSAEKVFEFEGTRNLNTDPIEITGLEGDKYDYSFMIFCDSSNNSTSGTFNINLNNDSTANYDRYRMRGINSASYSYVDDNLTADSIGEISRNRESRTSFVKGSLTGSSGANRKISSFSSSGYDPQLWMQDTYWTNTVDEVNEISFTDTVNGSYKWHIKVYRTPKEGDQGNWALVDTLTWNGESTTKSFTGLDGNTDEKYRIVYSGDSYVYAQLNGDTGSNYSGQILYNENGTIKAYNSTSDGAINLFYNSTAGQFNSDFIINAKSGHKRLTTGHSSKTSSYQQVTFASWWNNTTDNLTSVAIVPSGATTGTAKLYKLKDKTKSAGTLNWETIEEVQINGDFSSGHTFSGLTGDSETMYKLEFLGKNTSGNSSIIAYPNSDTTANYTRQYLRGTSSTASANLISPSTTPGLISLIRNGKISQGTLYFYPKSGSQRPFLSRYATDENLINYEANWWPNTTDEITSLFVKAFQTDNVTGTLRLSRLVDSVTETVNAVQVGPVALSESSTYTSGVYPSISGENAIEMLTKTGGFSLDADFLKMTLKRTEGTFDVANFQKSEGYKVDANYALTGTTSSSIYIYPPKLLRRVNNPPADFDNLGRPKEGVTVDIDNGSGGKVFYGMFQFEFALSQAISENVTVDVYMKTADFDFKKVAEIKPTPKPADSETPWIIRSYWNSRTSQFDWDGNAYKTAGAVQFKFEVR